MTSVAVANNDVSTRSNTMGDISSSVPATTKHLPESPSKSRIEVWKLEQEIIASMVQVEDDPPLDISIIPDNPLFHVLKDDHCDVYSFSSKPELYGGVDVSFFENGVDAVAVYVVIDKRTMTVVYKDYSYFKLQIPYVPTYLAFREITPLQTLVHRQVESYPNFTPKAILVDGNGILHPRHAGIACFLGTRTNIPTIGIGKSLLYEGGWTRESLQSKLDDFLWEVTKVLDKNSSTLPIHLAHVRGTIVKRTSPDPTNASKTGSTSGSDSSDMEMSDSMDRSKLLGRLSPLCNGVAIPLQGGEDHRFPILGCALVGHGGGASKPHVGTVKPIFVSVGHRMCLTKAIQITASLSLYKIPEPVRQADLFGRELIRNPPKENDNTTTTTTTTLDQKMPAH